MTPRQTERTAVFQNQGFRSIYGLFQIGLFVFALVQRPFRRMYKGDTDGFGDIARTYALAGPELG